MKAFEVTGKIDEKGQLFLDEPLHLDTPSQVKVIILVSDEYQEHNHQREREDMKIRIEKVVNILMEERPLFKEEINAEQMIQHLCNIFQKNVSIDEFNSMEQEDLKNRFSSILSSNIGTMKEKEIKDIGKVKLEHLEYK